MAKWTKGRRVIWCSEYYTEEWFNELKAEHPDLSDDELDDLMYELKYCYLCDERANFSAIPVGNIIAIGVAGRWNGFHSAFANIGYGDLSKTLYPTCDVIKIEWFVSTRGDLVCEETHHDGKNFWIYRELKQGVTVRQLDNFIEKVVSGAHTRADINKISTRLGDKIAELYGW